MTSETKKRARLDDDSEEQPVKKVISTWKELSVELQKRIEYLETAASNVVAEVRYTKDIAGCLQADLDARPDEIDRAKLWLIEARNEAIIAHFEKVTPTVYPRCTISGCDVIVGDEEKLCTNKHKICSVCVEYLHDYPKRYLHCGKCGDICHKDLSANAVAQESEK